MAKREPYQPYLGEQWKLNDTTGEVRDKSSNRQIGHIKGTGYFIGEMMTASPELVTMLTRLTEKVERANSIQHSGGKIHAEDWSELYALTNDARALLHRLAIK